jgi:enamine deaminase RidA (YjgF/YER057c/UK114 family)
MLKTRATVTRRFDGGKITREGDMDRNVLQTTNAPARAAYAVGKLPLGALVEIEAIALA